MTAFRRSDSGLLVPGYEPSQLQIRRLNRPLRPIAGGAASTYCIFNGPMAVTTAPTPQPTGNNVIRTQMQLVAAAGQAFRPVAWGISFNGSQAAVPGVCELIDTLTVPATGLNAYAVSDIQPYSDPNAPVNTAGASGVPFNLGTGASGYSSGAATEGSIVGTRMCDVQEIAPTAQYNYQFPLGREFGVPPTHVLRIRTTFPVLVNCICYVVVEV